jgi:hypothetical protein
VGAQFAFAQIDGKGLTASRLESMLTGELLPYYEDGALYGLTPAQAFNVETGKALNTLEVAEKLQLLALVTLKMSEDAEQVQIMIAKVALAGSVG